MIPERFDLTQVGIGRLREEHPHTPEAIDAADAREEVVVTPEQIRADLWIADAWIEWRVRYLDRARAAAFPPGTARLPRLAVDAH